VHPTQRRLIVALVVTVACLPLLVLDLMGGQGGGVPDQASVVTPDVPEPSLVVAVSPSAAPTTSSTTTSTVAAAVVTTTPPTTAAPQTTTTAAPRLPKATTTTTRPAPAPAPPPPAASGPTPTASEASFLACVRHRESRGIYTAVDPTGQFMGAYQIYQGGWDAVARSIGRGDLVGRPPHTVAPADQDTVALAMLRQYGTKPWGGACG
jgi:hypothetical protein